MAKETKELAKQETKELARVEQPPRGFDNFTNDDLIIPRLRLLQGLSQAVVDGIGSIGQWQDSLTGEILGDSVEIVLLGKKNGAVMFENGSMACKSDDGQINMHGDLCSSCPHGCYHGQEWKDGEAPPACASTIDFTCITRKTLSGDEIRPIVMSFSKTAYKVGRKLASMARFSGKDIFACAYKLSSEKVKKPKGTIAVPIVTPAGRLSAEDLAHAENWYNMFGKGSVKVHDDAPVAAEDAEDIKV